MGGAFSFNPRAARIRSKSTFTSSLHFLFPGFLSDLGASVVKKHLS
jgi:hypothetical protein